MDIPKNFALAFNAGVGQVAASTSGLALSGFHPSVGFGARYKIDPLARSSLRLDLGVGEDEMGVYFTFDEPF
jgi:hypothetical protein